MTRKTRKMLILAVFCLIGALIAIPGMMINSRNSNISSVQSALLNPKYADKVNLITLSFPDGTETLSFRKGTGIQDNEVWIGTTADGIQFPANGTILTQLIERASKTISMAQISGSFSAWNALGLSDADAIHLTFENDSNGNQTVFSSLFFGFENADGSMIYVRSDRKSTSWRISDTFSSYLTENVSNWADQKLLPVSKENETDSSRTCIRIETGDSSRTLYDDIENSERFHDIVHTLLSLRSSEICSEAEFTNQVSKPEQVLTVTLEGARASENAYGFHLYKADYDDETVWFVRNFGILSRDDAPYCQVISSWSVSRINEALGL